MQALRKVTLGLVWFVITYFALCMLVGMFAGAVAGARDPDHAHEAGRVAGQHAVQLYIPYILGGSILFAVVGTVIGFLPGTKSKKPPTA
jgi:hypothetical protein